MSRFVSQGQSIQQRPAGSQLCCVCAEHFIWEFALFCGYCSLHTTTTQRDRGKKNIKWES